MNNNYEKIKEIIENGYGIDEIKYIFEKNNNNYNDILCNVIYNQDYKTFEHIKPYLNLEDRNSWLLNIAIKQNNIYFFNYFIDNCGDDITDALELSAEIGNSLMVQKILNKKNYNVDVNNALRYAVIENNIECVKLLLPLSSNYNKDFKFEIINENIKKSLELINDAILNLKLKEELFKDDFKEKNKRKI